MTSNSPHASSGSSINSGRTFSSNSSGLKKPNATVASFNVVPSLCAFFAHFATSVHRTMRHSLVNRTVDAKRKERTVVAEMAVQDSRQHERLVQQGVDALLVRLDTNNAVLRERA